jgi:sugar/nucleoside kinase (ribokinase family)
LSFAGVEVVDHFGTGDAWDSGFFYGYLARSDPQYAVDFANTLGELAHTMPGDVAHLTVEGVEAVMQSGHLDVRR